MAHTPHLFLPPPWSGEALGLHSAHLTHLFKALRLGIGTEVTYTDGQGHMGSGHLAATHLLRGHEWSIAPPLDLEIAVAPPHERDRIRFLVEKASELEVRRIRWLRARFGNARSAQIARAGEWAIAALEQSRGAWLTSVDPEWTDPGELDSGRSNVVADFEGDSDPPQPPLRVVVGPEGGWADGELSPAWPRLSLGRNILRTETAVLAAIVAVSSHWTNFAGD